MQALLTTLILIYLTLMILFKLISSFKSSKIFTLILLVSVHRIAVVPPDEQTVHQITEIELLLHFLISFNNVCRYLLTVLSKQQLIQPLGYLTSSELLRSKAK